jgi:hypothetical protein
VRWVEDPLSGTPSGALVIETETVPTASERMFITAGGVRLGTLFRCAHPLVMREEPITNNGINFRSLILAPSRL